MAAREMRLHLELPSALGNEGCTRWLLRLASHASFDSLSQLSKLPGGRALLALVSKICGSPFSQRQAIFHKCLTLLSQLINKHANASLAPITVDLDKA